MELLSISPPELIFFAPYERIQRRSLTLMNPTSNTVIFKLKSNVYRHYCVSPVRGLIKAYSCAEISVNLNFFNFEKGRKYRHRFCVHCLPVPADFAVCVKHTLQRAHPSKVYRKSITIQLKAQPLQCSEMEAPYSPLESPEQFCKEVREINPPLCPKWDDVFKTPDTTAPKSFFQRHTTLLALLIIAGSIALVWTGLGLGSMEEKILLETE